MALILDGRIASAALADELRSRIKRLKQAPTLAIIQIGDKPESSAYIERKKAFGRSIGARVMHIKINDNESDEEIISRIKELNKDGFINGIILQLPFPSYLNSRKLLDAVALAKDTDGLHSQNVSVVPATARGILSLLKFYKIAISGRRVVVLGRSMLVGAPTAEVLRKEGAEVTVCHSKTVDTKEITLASDIVVVAIGRPLLIDASYFREDKTQVVIDVGITAVMEKEIKRLEEEIPKRHIVGDVDFDSVKDYVAAISPVPGGVGPMTVASLFANLVDSMI